ncbi:MAG: hypothetical protein JWM09_325 [Francisellaceae bacterium]|nr:hypothetical protein [Francisellaceae bacterium]
MDRKALLKTLIYEVFGSGQLQVIDNLYASSGIFKHSFGSSIGPEGVKEYVNNWMLAMPKARIAIEDLLQDGNKFAIRWKGKGIHEGEYNGFAATGQLITLSGLATVHMNDEKILECHITSNILNMLGQHMPSFVSLSPPLELETSLNTIINKKLNNDEIKILTLWVWGASNFEIQKFLKKEFLSDIKFLQESICSKFRVKDKHEILDILYNNNLLSLISNYAKILLSRNALPIN